MTNRYRDLTYEAVGRNQVFLTEEEEIDTINTYKDLRDTLHKYLLQRTKCRQWLIDRYEKLSNAGRSTAKLCASYNPRERGHNSTIELKFARALTPLPNVESKSLSALLFDLELSEDCYAEMIKLVRSTVELRVLQEGIHKIERILLCSMLMAGQEIANNYAANIINIDKADAAQEVNVYLLDSIRKYNPDYRTAQGQRVKLCTYAYGRAENLLKEWIFSNNRLVRIPRSKRERILIIVKAYSNLNQNEANLFTLSVEANKILKERRGRLTKADTFDTDEVDDLIKILMSSYIHLDQPYSKQNRSSRTTIGDLLSKKGPSVIDEIEYKTNKRHLLETMKRSLTKLEYRIITLRYFSDPKDKTPKAYTEVSSLLASSYKGREYSRESIRKIEKVAIDKLKNIKEVQQLW